MNKLYGIIGDAPEIPLFVAMHQAAFEAEKVEAEFRRLEIDPVDPEALANFCYESDLNDISGFVVTPPYQLSVMDYLDHFDVLAKKLGIIDVVQNEASNLNGFNSMVTAVVRAVQEKADISHKKALVLGAGHAAEAAIYGLKEFGAEVFVWNRTTAKAEALAEGYDIETVEFRDIKGAEFDLIIHATPVGQQTEESLLTSEQIPAHAVVLDLAYKPGGTRLQEEAKKAGATCILTERVFLHQAAGQFEIWFEKPAPLEKMEKVLL